MSELWNYRGDSIFKKGELFLKLPSIVIKILVLDTSMVILLKHSSATGNQNICCYDFNQVMKWQISPPVEFHEQNDFTGIYTNNNALYAYNRNGVEYQLDIESGKVLRTQLIK